MKYTDGFNKIESPFNWIESVFIEVFDGEDTSKETFYSNSCEDLITTQNGNYNDSYGTDYKITEKQKILLKKKWIKLKEKYKDVEDWHN